MSGAKPVVKISAMAPQMQADACTAAADALSMFYEENDVAGYVKQEFEKKVRRVVSSIDRFCFASSNC